MNISTLLKEIGFKAARSSGAGGQHVNKVASKVTLIFDLINSQGVTENQKILLQQKLTSRLTNEAVLLLHCEESRSQHRNKELVIKRFISLITTNLTPVKKRKRTKPSRSSIRKRLEGKKQQANKKMNRRKPDSDY